VENASASVLRNGRVLVFGGVNIHTLYQCGKAQIFDPYTHTRSNVADMFTDRCYASQSTLVGGKVLVCGGSSTTNCLVEILKTTEIYDPDSNTWNSGPDLPHEIVAPSQCTLKDGRVLICGNKCRRTQSQETFLFNPRTISWSTCAPIPV